MPTDLTPATLERLRKTLTRLGSAPLVRFGSEHDTAPWHQPTVSDADAADLRLAARALELLAAPDRYRLSVNYDAPDDRGDWPGGWWCDDPNGPCPPTGDTYPTAIDALEAALAHTRAEEEPRG